MKESFFESKLVMVWFSFFVIYNTHSSSHNIAITYQSKTAAATVSLLCCTQVGSFKSSTDAPCVFKYSLATSPIKTCLPYSAKLSSRFANVRILLRRAKCRTTDLESIMIAILWWWLQQLLQRYSCKCEMPIQTPEVCISGSSARLENYCTSFFPASMIFLSVVLLEAGEI